MVKEIYPHNDLLNASFHILEKIEAAVKEGIEDGITLDCIAVSYTHLTLPTTPYV